MSESDSLLLGVDLIKDKSILEPAYDDALGVTAAFNLNVLARINRELAGNFDLDKFLHRAFLDEELGRIEMHLESREAQIVTIDELNQRFYFAQGETIHTENSYKYSIPQVEEMVLRNGFFLKKSWLDDKRWFSLNLLQPIDD